MSADSFTILLTGADQRRMAGMSGAECVRFIQGKVQRKQPKQPRPARKLPEPSRIFRIHVCRSGKTFNARVTGDGFTRRSEFGYEEAAMFCAHAFCVTRNLRQRALKRDGKKNLWLLYVEAP